MLNRFLESLTRFQAKRVTPELRLATLLKQAHAIEIGAYHAYAGHWRSLPKRSKERQKVHEIQIEELKHRQSIAEMLKAIDARPSWVLDWTFWIIGKSISFACGFMHRKLAMYGAQVMERVGDLCYGRIAKEARTNGLTFMASKLETMQRAEQAHEEYFRSQV